MELVTVARDVPRRGAGNLVAIGKWDGVHRAHQAIIAGLVREAASIGGQSVVMGFDPLPMSVLRPDRAPPVLQTLAERAETMAAMGVDIHLAIPFNRTFAALSPDQFVQEVLVRDLQARHVMVGYNFTFGKGGQGNTETLIRLCRAQQIGVTVVPALQRDGEPISSTRVRCCLSAGDLEGAAALLGRSVTVDGRVLHQQTPDHLRVRLTGRLNRQLPPPGCYPVRVTALEPSGSAALVPPCSVTVRNGPSYEGRLNLRRGGSANAGDELYGEVRLLASPGRLAGVDLRLEFLGQSEATLHEVS